MDKDSFSQTYHESYVKSNRSLSFFYGLFVSILVLALFLAGLYFLPWRDVKWGKFELSQPSTIVVTGKADSREKTQVANFTAGVSFVSDSKDEAVNFVNQKVEEIITALLKFGIDKSDIKTQNLSIYQQQENYWEEGRQKTRPGQWRVDNNISVILRDVNKASDLSKIFTQTGATNVYGPSFYFEDTKSVEDSLFGEALEDAKSKAEKMAELSGKKIVRILNIYEGYSSPYYYSLPGGFGGGGGGSAMPVEPGSGLVSKTITVVFEVE